MVYRKFGNTGKMISALGFGTMRLPEYQKGEEWYVDEDKTVEMIRRGIQLGINYFDTAYFYNHYKGEVAVGKALKGYRNKVYLSSKIATWFVKKKDDYRRLLDEQLKKIDTDYIDFYHFHALNTDRYENIFKKFSLIDEAIKAKEEGLIKHISFSFHDKPDLLIELIDTEFFETLLCQYNLIDRSNEQALAHAKSKGIGTVVMGPVAGGRLAGSSKVLERNSDGKKTSSVETALKFVFSNPNVSCVLSGMENIDMLEQNVKIVSEMKVLSEKEKDDIRQLAEEMKKLSEIYCTGCSYCLPCKEGIKIPEVFKCLINYKVYGLEELAFKEYEKIINSNDPENQPASRCTKCGVCEKRCPQNINIRQQLEMVSKTLTRR